MENHKKEIKQIKIAIITVVIALVFLAAGFGIVTNNNREHLHQKDLQINSLIDEVGNLKESNDDLYRKMNQDNADFENLYKEMYQVTIQNQQFHATAENLQNLQKDLTNQIQEKEQIIADLAQKNNDMKNEQSVPKFDDKTTDILILGQNKGLTDTIILMMINPDNKKVTFISIPRDLSYKGRKINELEHAYGIEKLEEAIYQITNVYPDKYVLVDFSALTKLVDAMGGIDIDVEKNLVDKAYPGTNNSYIVVKFNKGVQHMDGDTALKYARSRHSTSDFDRSKRQQQVLQAIKVKAGEINILGNTQLVGSTFENIKKNVKTDISVFEALSYFEKFSGYTFNGGNTINTQNYLISTINKAGQYILLPITKNYTQIKEYVASLVQ
jgi:LCP family protein required for cell wall assembly